MTTLGLGPRRSNIPSLICAFTASATTGGTIYAFGIFANDLKSSLHLTQLQLGAVSSAFFISGLISWIPGMVVDRMKMRFSMTVGGFTGALFTMMYWFACVDPNRFSFFGGGSSSSIMTTHPVTVLSILAVAISLSCGLIVGSVFKITMLCGGQHGRGPCVGIAKGFVGVGSGVYATIFQAFRERDESALDFLPVIAFFFVLCAGLPALFLLPSRAEEEQSGRLKIETTPMHFRTMYLTLLVLCLYIVTSAINDIIKEQEEHGGVGVGKSSGSSTGREYGKIALILMLWLGPIAALFYLPRQEEFELSTLLPPKNCIKGNKSNGSIRYGSIAGTLTPTEECDEEELSDDNDDPNTPYQPLLHCSSSTKPTLLPPDNLVKTSKNNNSTSSCCSRIAGVNVTSRPELSLPEMLQTPSAWLMLWTTSILVGSGTAKTNNMGEMVESLGFDEAVTPATLAIFSVAQAAARIVTGIVSEAALNSNTTTQHGRRSIARPWFLVLASAVALVGHLILAATNTSLVAFVGGCAISAIAFGMSWPLMVLIVGDVFGVEHHGANYMFFDGLTKAIGTTFLSEYLTGSVYQAHISTSNTALVGGAATKSVGTASKLLVAKRAGIDAFTCYGPHCFQMTHLVIAGLALTGILASVLLLKTSRHAYANR
jgi:MFS family permease